jgi:hypothetical protein
MKRLLAIALVASAVLAAPPSIRADEVDQLEYGIQQSDGHLQGWVNLSALVTSQWLENLREGVDYLIAYDLALLRPRRVWGAETMANASGYIRISYRIITEDYLVEGPTSDSSASRSFVALPKLHAFLADSLIVNVALIDSLNSDNRYVLEVELDCARSSIVDFVTGRDDPDRSESPIKYLFKKFLQVTGQGRNTYKFKSEPFSLTEIGDPR